jgi:hypothetical protein
LFLEIRRVASARGRIDDALNRKQINAEALEKVRHEGNSMRKSGGTDENQNKPSNQVNQPLDTMSQVLARVQARFPLNSLAITAKPVTVCGMIRAVQSACHEADGIDVALAGRLRR